MTEGVRENGLYYDAVGYTSKVVAWVDENYQDNLYVAVYDGYNFGLYHCSGYMNSDSFEESWYDWGGDDIKNLLSFFDRNYVDIIDGSRVALTYLANIMLKRVPGTSGIYDDKICGVVEDYQYVYSVGASITNSIEIAHKLIEKVDELDPTAEYSCNAEELKERIDKVKGLRNNNNNNIVVYKHN